MTRAQDVIIGLKRLLPAGTSLPREVWEGRHRGILALLWVHVGGVFVFGLTQGRTVSHMVMESSIIAVAAAVGTVGKLSAKTRMVATTLGLLSASAILVHLADGLIEMHFHFFVMVAVVTLYQSWVPFLLAVGYVVVHHGVLGVVDPAGVFNHPSAIARPWTWATIHGVFILGESAACLTAWRVSEEEGARADQFLSRLAAIVRSSRDAIIGLSPKGVIVGCNPAAEALFGYSSEEMIGSAGTMLVAPESRHVESDALRRVLANEPVDRYEIQGLRKDGSLLDIAVAFSPVKEGDTVVGASVIVHDVTERKLAEREREESLSLLNATLDSTADGILVVNGDGKIINFNRQFLEMWKIPEDIVASRDDEKAIEFVLSQLVDPEGFLAKVKELYADPQARSFDVLSFKDGRAFERYSQPQVVGTKTVGRVWSFRDVTEKHRAQEHLQKAFDHERDAAQRLRELDDIKNAFLEAVSHELRTPLTSVLGYSVTLEKRDDQLDDAQRAVMLRALSRNARKLERLLSDLLDLDRLVKGVLEPNSSPTVVRALVDSIIQEIDHPNHPLEVSVADVTADLDASKVQRMIENLVINATKYTPAGTHIWVTVEPDEHGLQIIVEDDGQGIPADLKEKIFKPFERGGQNKHSPGTGIGLALVARFAELHGGKAWVEARQGGGASFHVRIVCPVTNNIPAIHLHTS